TRAGGRCQAERDRIVLDGEVTQRTRRQPRQHQVAVLGLPLHTTRRLGVDTGPQLQRETGLTRQVTDVEPVAVALRIRHRFLTGSDREQVGVDPAEINRDLDTGHRPARRDTDTQVAGHVADTDLFPVVGLRGELHRHHTAGNYLAAVPVDRGA